MKIGNLLAELVDDADVVFHLAAAVGVKLIVESPVRTIETNVNGTQLVLEAACKKRKLVLAGLHFRSLREEHQRAVPRRCRPGAGPDHQGPLELRGFEGPGRIPGALLLEGEEAAGHRRAVLQYGGPAADRPLRHGAAEFRSAALENEPIEVFGDGKQSRCFCDVRDTVEALLRLMAAGTAVGEVINIGNTEEVTIEDLAKMVKQRTGSSSPIHYIPYDKAYEPGFEDMMRRVPCIDKLHALTAFAHRPVWRISSTESRPITGKRKGFRRAPPRALSPEPWGGKNSARTDFPTDADTELAEQQSTASSRVARRNNHMAI